MKRLVIFTVSGILLLVFGSTFVLSFAEYSTERERKIVKNIATFMVNTQEDRNIVNIPEPDYSLITLRTKDGKSFISSNMNLPFDSSLYLSTRASVGGSSAIVYYKKVSLSDYLLFLVSKPVYLGMLGASAFLFIALLIYISGETRQIVGKTTVDEKFMDKVKALRLTLSTMKIVPEESAQEMKKVIDSILKESK